MSSNQTSTQRETTGENLPDGLPKILLSVYSNDKILYQRYYPNTATFGDLIEDFESNIKETQIKNKIEYNFKKKKVNKKDRIIDMNKIDKNSKLIDINVILDFSDLSLEKEPKNTPLKKIFKPQSNPFNIISYSPKEGDITLETYPQKDIIENSLDEFSDKSSYCNSNDALYISGGEKDGKALNHFWKIDHNRKVVEHSEMPISKSNHSMIFIPEKYVLIAGGNNKDCLLYDTEKKVFNKWGNLNDDIVKPCLILDNDNVVYCFNNFSGSKKNFEKSDLKAFPIWEKINPKVASNPFDLKNFSAVKTSDGNVLLFGGNELGKNKKFFIYDPKKNELKNIDTPNQIIESNDKNFYPINNYISVNIPDDFNKDKELLILNKNNQTLKKIPFEITESEKIIDDQIDYKVPNNLGTGSFTMRSRSKQIPEIQEEDLSDEEEKDEKQNKSKGPPKPPPKIKGIANLGNVLKKKLTLLKDKDDKDNNVEIISGVIPGVEKKDNKDIGNDKVKDLINKLEENEKMNKLRSAVKKNPNLDRSKINNNLVTLSTPQLHKGSTNLDLPPPEEEKKVVKKEEEPKIEKIETLNDEMTEREEDPGQFHPIKLQSIPKLKIPLSSYGSNVERDILDKQAIDNNNIKGETINIISPEIKVESDNINLNTPKIDLKGKSGNDNIKITGKFPGVEIDKNEEKKSIQNSAIYNLEPTTKYEVPDFSGGKDFTKPDIKTTLTQKDEYEEIEISGEEGEEGEIIETTTTTKKIKKKGKGKPVVSTTTNTVITKEVVIGPNETISGVIPGKKIDNNLPNVNVQEGEININNTPSDENVNDDFNFIETDEGYTPILLKNIITQDINDPVHLNKMNIQPHNIEIDGFSGTVNGKNIKIPNKNLKFPQLKHNVQIHNPNVKSNIPGVNVKGETGEINVNVPGIDANAGKVNVHAPNINMKGKGDVDITGTIPGVSTGKIDINAPKVDVKAPKVDINAPKVDVKGKGDINVPDVDITGTIPGVSTGKIDVNAPKVLI